MGKKSHYEINIFLQYTSATINHTLLFSTFCNLLFAKITALSLLLYCLISLENIWQEIRDHSFIQNLSRSFRFPAPCWCFFSSVHRIHFLQGSGQRTGTAMAEAWFCSQWPIFVLILMVVWGSLSCWKIQPWSIIRFLA